MLFRWAVENKNALDVVFVVLRMLFWGVAVGRCSKFGLKCDFAMKASKTASGGRLREI